MSNEGTYTDEELMYAMYRQEGPIWDEAYRRAIMERAPGQLMSFFFGVVSSRALRVTRRLTASTAITHA